MSIFQEYYKSGPLIDRYASNPGEAVDVIIPVIHTNEIWEANLRSYYREIPIHRLLLGDGGCVDNSLEVARRFPRVEVLDHRDFISLGFSIRKLIEAVETEWFVYLHSDVYLPEGWFDTMREHQGEFDWFQCRQRMTALVEFDSYDESDYLKRAYSGSQMGRKGAFEQVLPQIDDDYLYRNEDIILAHLVENAGFQYGHVNDTFHYHQIMYKQSKWKRQVAQIEFRVETSPEEEIRTHMMNVKGIIKYMQPAPLLIQAVRIGSKRLYELNQLTWSDLRDWARIHNPVWVPYIKKPGRFADKVMNLLMRLYTKYFKRLL